MRLPRLCGSALALASLAGCASGHYPELPAPADYARSCPELIDAYVKTDAGYQERRSISSKADTTIAIGTVVGVLASSGAAAPILLGGIAVSSLKGDLGANKKAAERDKLEQIAIHNGCTSSDVTQRQAQIKALGQAPAANSQAE